MKKRIACLALTAALGLGLASGASAAAKTPTLMYTYAGSYATGWCEESYNSTPAVADLDGDGKNEIIAASYSIMCIDAASGALKWRIPSGYDITNTGAQYTGRVWSDVVVKDVDGDGKLEIVIGNSAGTLAVYDNTGRFKPGWPKTLVAGMEIKSVRAEDLEGDGKCEIIAAVGDPDTPNSSLNVWVYGSDGALRSGWPQLYAGQDGAQSPSAAVKGYAWGVYNDNLAVGDINGDGVKEIIVPSDLPFICAYDPSGNLLMANSSVFGQNISWGNVGFWEDYSFEKKVENGGWGYETDGFTGYRWILSALPQSRCYTADFTYSKAVIDDLDGDGKNEVAVVGRVYDRAKGFPSPWNPSAYQSLYVLNGDRTRYSGWETLKHGGAPLSEDWNRIEVCVPDPVTADIDGDGRKEILYPSYDGTLNCYWLDNSQKHSWPVKVFDGSTMEFASAPAVKDIDGDGKSEIIFTTYTDKKGAKTGSLYVCNYKGEVLQKVTLPQSQSSGNPPNGGIGSPLVADIDGDGVFEVVFNGFYSAVTVYKLPV